MTPLFLTARFIALGPKRNAMTVTIELPPELEETLRQQAAKSGQDLDTFVLQALKEKIARTRTFDEICAPFAQAVEAARITDEEFDRFFEEVREEAWQERQSKAS
jgi:predicted transcriptional regulator